MEIIKNYSSDSVRYYLLREIPSYNDGDYSERRFKEVYNADLANGLGNLIARVAKLCEKNKFAFNLGSVSLGLFIWGLMFQRRVGFRKLHCVPKK